MCIVCNCGDAAFPYLDAFAAASAHMERAATAMLDCAKVAKTPEQRKQYDATHKAMVRLKREWHKLEHTREVLPWR